VVLLVLHQPLQLLHLLAELLGRREALGHLHEESRQLVAAQQAGRPPLQPVQQTRLHRGYTPRTRGNHMGERQRERERERPVNACLLHCTRVCIRGGNPQALQRFISCDFHLLK